MTVKETLIFGAKQLSKIDSPQLDAAILLSAAIKKPKEFLYTYPEKKLTPAQITKFKNFIARRAKHEPAAYILGKKEFYGFEFAVNKNVLIPRPDTETLINAVLSTVGHSATYSYPHHFAPELSRATRCKQIIIDVGTGSGTIAVTLKKLLPKAQVFASDVSSAALNLAKNNAHRLGAKIKFLKGNLLSPSKSLLSVTRYPLVITANLPYLSRAEWQKTAPEVKKYEPYGALVGGKTGTEIYEKLFEELAKISPTNTCLFIEIGHKQKPAITKLAKKILHPQKIEFFKDLSGHWRVAKISLN